MVRHHHNLTINTDRQFYLPGDEVKGTVKLVPKKACAMNSVKITFFGEEFCHYNQVVAHKGSYEPVTRTIFKKDTNFVTEKTRFDVQEYSWDFRYVIPRNIPPSTSVRKQKQYILYELRAHISTGFGHFDEVVKHPIIIGQVWVPPPPVPAKKTHKTMAGDIRLEAICNATVASVGEEIRCAVNFRNASYKSIVGLKMKLKQVWECENVIYHKAIVCKKSTKEGFPLNSGNATKMISMIIPESVQQAPTVKNAGFFKCTYSISLYGVTRMGGMIEKDAVKVKLPIIIARNANAAIDTVEEEESALSPSQPLRIRRNTDPENPSSRSSSRSASPVNDEVIRGLNAISSWANPSSAPARANSLPQRTPSGTFIEDFNHIFNNPVLSANSHVNAQGEIDDESAFAPAADVKEDSDDADAECKECDHDDGEKDDLKKSSTGECVVCFDGAKNMLLLPCAHISTCYTCTTQIMKTSKNCPVCRSRITQIVRTYRV